MEKRYSEMTVEELREVVAKYKEQAQKAEQMGNINEYAVYQRKVQMALSYMMNPEDFKRGETYEIVGDPGQTFTISYINGVFAWGYRFNVIGQKHEKQEALPISVLGKKVQP